jgi:hypothetical protein
VYAKEKWISLEVDLCIQEEIHRDLVPEMAVVDQVVCFLQVKLVIGDNVLDEE